MISRVLSVNFFVYCVSKHSERDSLYHICDPSQHIYRFIELIIIIIVLQRIVVVVIIVVVHRRVCNEWYNVRNIQGMHVAAAVTAAEI